MKQSDLKYLIQETILIIIIVYLLLFASTYNGLMQSTTLGITAGLFMFLFILLVIYFHPVQISIERALYVFLIVIIMTVITSIDARRSIGEVWLVAAASFLMIVTASIVRRGWPAEMIAKVLLIVVGIIMVFSWIDAGGWYLEWLKTVPGQWLPWMAYRLPLPNFLAIMLNISLMMALARIVISSKGAARIFLALWITSAVLLLYLTSSRSG